MGRSILWLLITSFVIYNFIPVYVDHKGLKSFLPVEDVFNGNKNGIDEEKDDAHLNPMISSMQNRQDALFKFNTNKNVEPIYRHFTDVREKNAVVIPNHPQKLDNRPLFVLHIGPHKTATSTIQCEMTYYQSLMESVGNFTYLGRQYGECKNKSTLLKYNNINVNSRDLVRCLDNHNALSPCNSTKDWRNFEKALSKMSHVRQNVLLSDEAFSRMKLNNSSSLELLFHTIHKHKFRFKVILVYRHYFSWLLSQYNEHYKPLLSRSKYQIWPSIEGGKYIKPFIEYYASHHNKNSTSSRTDGRNYQSAANALGLHPVAYLIKQWTNNQIPFAPKESDILAIDMHNNDNNYGIVLNFVLTALSEEIAEELNRHKQDNANDTVPSRSNPSLNLDFDRMAVKARELGLFPDHDLFTRRRVALYTEMLFQNLTTKNEKMPRICLDEKTQIQEFLDLSLLLEKTVFPDRRNAQQQQHREDFAKAKSRNMFCNLDIEALLSQESVRAIFRKLEQMARSNQAAHDTEGN
eukprot:CAMPEP_0194226538 /NCGR_PEP_ID=MMETSP0156-20130528/42062_1 /TAXON_ID=33649 /ORGANISM="Thalassionema nitzschioides, Strain L26-B" /LENGTH=520 /DNA_ID=CAMNT_0038958919 /DNA_START=82 /DNA_END=1644 /DNA_ORIENTATION=+